MVVVSEWDVQRDAATGLQLELSTGRIRVLFQKAPLATFKRTREAFAEILSGHREQWLASKNAEFRGGGLNPTSLRSSDPTASGWFRRRSFFFVVKPSAKAVNGQVPDLESIQAEAFTESPVAQGLEEGGESRAKGRRFLALPIGVTLDAAGRPKSRWNTPERFKRFANNKLVSIRMPGTKSPVLYQVKRGRRAAEQTGAVMQIGEGRKKKRDRRILLPAYVLVPQVRRQRRLRFLETWDRLDADRGRRLGTGLARVVKELDGG